MSEDQNKTGQEPDNDVVFNESYDAQEVDSVVVGGESSDSNPAALEDYEDEDEIEENGYDTDEEEDELDRIPLGKETQKKDPKEYGLGVASMVLGIFSVIFFCVPVLGLVLALTSLILGIISVAKKNGKKMGIAGIVMGSMGLVAYLIVFLIFGGLFGGKDKGQEELENHAWRNTNDGSVLYLYGDGTFIDTAQEGIFSDNFYSGNYDILTYEDARLSSSKLESQYDMDHAYGVYLYVNTYVVNGEERDSIAPTMRYLYMFNKDYKTGDVVNVCAFDTSSGSLQYGTPYPVKEANMAYPTLGNQYVPTEALDTESETEELTTTEAETTEADATEAESTDSTSDDASSTEGNGAPSIDFNTEWGNFDDFSSAFEEEWSSRSEDFNQAASEASSVWEEASSSWENASSAWEDMGSAWNDASSAWEDASSAVEEWGETIDTDQVQGFFQKLLEWLQNLFSGWFG